MSNVSVSAPHDGIHTYFAYIHTSHDWRIMQRSLISFSAKIRNDEVVLVVVVRHLHP
jgi:hypothetical protein|uniref:Uncharacterized protein n=1 Tax=Zea mays TaxID=4577 RepID=C0PKJ8_MAIZE|nr:unknown [Zea mays]